MITVRDKNEDRVVRHKRVRRKISGTSERPRLCVTRSNAEIYSQIIDDVKGVTIVSASTREKEIAEKVVGKTKTEASRIVGEIVGQRAVAKGVSEVVFDRGGYIYTGRVKALADGARASGLKF